jgi:Phospholipase_D-nuclease N-terminal
MIGIQELAMIIFIAIPLGVILPIFALIDLRKNQLIGNKILWGLIIICIPLVGPILYYTTVRKQKSIS